ncbi:hypothetical protein COE67_06570 [Priestia megaterium]|uniref:hypothetical protein n=1 Tax=Priestia megaterium TaxID=1404 RepID=UPI000BFDBDE9|nr:hypothetical protein [Priestia megaterium]PGX43500.1 hypothetical protein COE67_06570 [Priestia megaterium]
MTFNPDKLTAFLYKAINILLIKNPERTAYGVVLGFVLIGAKEALVHLTTGKVMDAIQSINYVSIFCFGILLVRADIILKRNPVDKEVLIKFTTLKMTVNEANFSEVEQRKIYRDFIQRVYKDVEIKSSSSKGKSKTGTEQN